MENNTKILHSDKTVFTKKDILNILDFNTSMALDKYLFRAKKEGFLENPFYGIYTLKKYDIFEFACKLKKKSYISLETILKKEGVIFQYYENIFLISDNTLEKKIKIEGNKINNFSFNKIKDSILLNPLGLINKGNYTIASAERAVCDRFYLSKNYYFDDLSNLNFEKLEQISQIYNKRVILEINKIIKKYVK
ncbi:MAG: hypothetical protein Q9M94_00245 [Candidatus Gracilibacteria bacterium]|nr:hypothetical protein [Candidatus Gracilibacteria bacterium]MDQ7022645.1 hypothetical protein [Candidatus Gracilibacteria bacterium]